MRPILFALMLMMAAVACGEAEMTTDPDPVVEPRLAEGQIEILIDDMGVAHVYGGTDEDVFYGYGYQIASDRMLQLEMFRRRAYGRLGEVLGPGVEIEDNQAAMFHWKHWGRLDAEKMQTEQPERFALVQAWVAGINARIDEVHEGEVPLPLGYGPDELDFLPERWDDVDPIVVQKMAGFGLDQTIEYEIFVTFANRLFPAVLESVQLFKPARQVWTVPEMATAQAEPRMTPWVEPTPRGGFTPAEKPFAPLIKLGRMKGLGSNNWAVDGQHTDTGRPLLAGDPHIGCDFSGLMYPIHLNSADSHGSFDVVGYAFVAAPGIAAGHNRQVAWTPTSSFADVMDMWQVQISGDGAVIAGETIPVEERTEVIRVRGQEDREFNVTEVPGYGVVVPSTAVGSPLPLGENGKEVIVGWRGFGARTANYFLELNRVGDLDEFEAAVSRMPEMSYNFVAADSNGIAYQVGVEVPKRSTVAPGREPWLVMDGNDPEAWWQEGALGPEQLPHSRGEDQGWIATANNDPFGHTTTGYPGDAPYYYGAFFPPGWRAGRIVDEIERLTARGEVSLDDMMALQTDTHSNLADDLLPLLAEIEVEGGDEATLRSLLLDWDRQMQRDSAAALAFHIYAHLVTGLAISDDIPFIYDVVMQVQPVYLLKVASLALRGEFPRGDEVLQEGRDAILLQALTDTAALLRERFGSVDPAGYTLADLRQTNLDGGFGWGSELGTVPTDGGESTVNVTSTFFLGDDGAPADRFVGTWIPIERTITTFGEDGTPQAWTSMPQGNVADPASPHYDDLMEDWLEGGYRRLNFTREEVEAATERSLELRR